jgi:predicted nucleic acid-binding protein
VILLDTSVVSRALRRRRRGPEPDPVAARLAGLLEADVELGMPGIVLQELMSGIAEAAQARRVLHSVREGFVVVLATTGDHLGAADLVNACARKGLALSTPHALIAAQARNRRASLFTTDADFLPLVALAGLSLLE